MESVISQIFHSFEVQRFYTHEFIILLIVWQRKTQRIYRAEVDTFYKHFNNITLTVIPFSSTDFNGTIQFLNRLFTYTIFQLCCHYRNIISVNQTILINVAYTDIAFIVGITFSQTGIVGIRG